MKKKPIIVIKSFFCIITIIWSAIMLVEYLLVLIPIDLNNILFEIFDFLVIFLYAGILGVPVLFILSSIFIAIVGRKYKDSEKTSKLNVVTIILPITTFALMLVTNFNARLQ